ncbi:hypothetical protein SCP_0800890 [Sparassis crispa]|uniref:Uncharacterized protein n=1 Tax=Sparassis crispa TaxID=139825 RepID=A0A401GTM3_9APHY|nr:hypothetical protein SCP_0800890 [Sparassis crispa]GBE85572.1 hypothetical protein SCP_0800890 [Sparassis crispa]
MLLGDTHAQIHAMDVYLLVNGSGAVVIIDPHLPTRILTGLLSAIQAAQHIRDNAAGPTYSIDILLHLVRKARERNLFARSTVLKEFVEGAVPS